MKPSKEPPESHSDDDDPRPLRERLAAWRAANPLPPPTGLVADKAFFDELSGEESVPNITPEEHAARARVVTTRDTKRLGGFLVSSEAEAIRQRYIDGQITLEDMNAGIKKIHGR